MKTFKKSLVLSLTLLISASCGFTIKKGSRPIRVTLPKVHTEKLSCSLAHSTNMIGRELAPDSDIKFYRATIDKVLADLHAQTDSDPLKFWSNLSPEVRNTLNFELNFYLIKNPLISPLAAYQSTAYFFTNVKDSFSDRLNYRVKDLKGEIYFFTVRAVKNTGPYLFNYDCGHFRKTDLSQFKVGQEVRQISEVKEVYECRSPKKRMILMEMEKTLYLKAGEFLYQIPSAGLTENDRKRKLELNYASPEINIQMEVRKKRAEVIEEWEGKRSKLELSTPDYEVSEDAVCDSLKGSLQV